MSLPNNPFHEEPSAVPPGRNPYLVPILVVAAVLLAGGVAFALVKATSGGPPASVQDVADQGVSAAEDLDVDEGIALLCDRPSDSDVEDLNDLISEARKAADGDPDVSYEVSDVQDDGGAGKFTVSITTDEEALEGSHATIEVEVARRGEQSCISGFKPRDARFRTK